MTEIKIETDSDFCNALKEELGGHRAFPASLAAAPDPVRTALASAMAWQPSESGPSYSEKLDEIIAALRAQGSGTFPLAPVSRDTIARIIDPSNYPDEDNDEYCFCSQCREERKAEQSIALEKADAILSLPAESGAREGWQPIKNAPGYIQEYGRMRSRNIPRGDVVQLGGSMEGGALFLFGHDALTHEVKQWLVIPQLLDAPPVSRPHQPSEAK